MIMGALSHKGQELDSLFPIFLKYYCNKINKSNHDVKSRCANYK